MGFVNAKKEIFVPYMRINVKFFVKEECELNSFQTFLLEALQEGATVDQIEQATQLTKNVIETELLQMEIQKLVTRDCEKIIATDLSKKILLISKKVKELNQEEVPMCINLISGEVDSYEEADYATPTKEDLIIRRKIFDLDGVSIEGNISFFSDKMRSLESCDEQEKEMILSSIYVEIYRDKLNGREQNLIYRKMTCKYLPCLIGADICVSEQDREADIIMEGDMIKLVFGYTYSDKDKYKDVVNNLKYIEQLFPELVSEKGTELLRIDNLCKSYEDNSISALFDCVSGEYIVNPKFRINPTRKKAQMFLREMRLLNEETKKRIIDDLRNMQKIDEKIDVFIKFEEKEKYTTQIHLESLWEQE